MFKASLHTKLVYLDIDNCALVLLKVRQFVLEKDFLNKILKEKICHCWSKKRILPRTYPTILSNKKPIIRHYRTNINWYPCLNNSQQSRIPKTTVLKPTTKRKYFSMFLNFGRDPQWIHQYYLYWNTAKLVAFSYWEFQTF